MKEILWSITIIAQLVCIYKVFNENNSDNIIFYRDMIIALGICGICIANIPVIEPIDFDEEIWLFIN